MSKINIDEYKNAILTLENTGNVDGILEEFHENLKNDPGNLWIFKAAAAALGRLNKRDLAIRIYSDALKVENHPSIYAFRGMTFLRMKNFRLASQDFVDCIEAEENGRWTPTCLQYGAYCYAQLGNAQKANEWLTELRKEIGEQNYAEGRKSFCGVEISNQIIEKLIEH